MPQKRIKFVFTIRNKLEIIHELQQGKSQRLVAEKFEVANSTVCDVWKDQES